MSSVTKPQRSRTPIAVGLILAGFALMGLCGYWAYTKVVQLIDAMDCRPAVAIETTGRTMDEANAAVESTWRQKVQEALGPEFASSGLKLNPQKSCSGTGTTYTCRLSAQPCIWKKR